MYTFRLEPVLRHRRLVEEELQRDLGLLKRELLLQEERLTGLEQARTRFSRELKKKEQTGITVADALVYNDFLSQVSTDIESQSKRVLEARKNLDRKRDELVKAMKNRKILEKLREKGHHAHLQEEAKKEQELINEAAINLFNRRR